MCWVEYQFGQKNVIAALVDLCEEPVSLAHATVELRMSLLEIGTWWPVKRWGVLRRERMSIASSRVLGEKTGKVEG
jgi:hypothetical protein